MNKESALYRLDKYSKGDLLMVNGYEIQGSIFTMLANVLLTHGETIPTSAKLTSMQQCIAERPVKSGSITSVSMHQCVAECPVRHLDLTGLFLHELVLDNERCLQHLISRLLYMSM